MRRTHISVNFLLGHKSRNRVHHHNIHGTRAHQRFGHIQGLFSGIGLRNQHFSDVYPQRLCILRVQSVLGVHKSGHAPLLLNLCHSVQCDRRFSGRFRPENFDDPASWKTPHAQGHIQCQGAGGHSGNHHIAAVPQPHDRPGTKFFLDLGNCRI